MTGRALGVISWHKISKLGLKLLHPGQPLRDGQLRQAGTFLGKNHFSNGDDCTVEQFASLLRLRPVIDERAVEKHDLRGSLRNLVIDTFEGGLCRRDQQAKHHRSQCREQASAHCDDTHRIIGQVMVSQQGAKITAEHCAAEDTHKYDRTDAQWAHKVSLRGNEKLPLPQ